LKTFFKRSLKNLSTNADKTGVGERRKEVRKMDTGAVGTNEIVNVASVMRNTPVEAPSSSVLKVTAPVEQARNDSLSANKQDNNDEPSVAQLKQMVAEMQGHLDSMNVRLKYFLYGAHENKVAVKVLDSETGKVIREIPPKEMQALQTKMGELVGMLFDKKA
jgi:flagellar protein FlaG